MCSRLSITRLWITNDCMIKSVHFNFHKVPWGPAFCSPSRLWLILTDPPQQSRDCISSRVHSGLWTPPYSRCVCPPLTGCYNVMELNSGNIQATSTSSSFLGFPARSCSPFPTWASFRTIWLPLENNYYLFIKCCFCVSSRLPRAIIISSRYHSQ